MRRGPVLFALLLAAIGAGGLWRALAPKPPLGAPVGGTPPGTTAGRTTAETGSVAAGLRGTPGAAARAEVDLSNADVATTLAAVRFSPPALPASVVARLRALVAKRPGLLEVWIATAIYDEPLPEDPTFDGGPGPKWATYWALVAVGPPAAKALADRLQDERDPKLQEDLLRALCAFEDDGAAAAVLISVLRDPKTTDRVRWYTAEALAHAGDAGRPAIPDLAEHAERPNGAMWQISLQSVLTLAGPSSPEAQAVVTQLLQRDDPVLLATVLETVGRTLGAEAVPLRPAIENLLGHESSDVRAWALFALARTGVEDVATIQRIGHLVEDETEEGEKQAIAVLAASGKAGQDELVQVARRADLLEVALHACQALDARGYPLADHLDVVLPLYLDGEDQVATGVLRLLSTMQPGPRARDVLDLLRRQIQSSEDPHRFAALWILANVEGDDAAVEKLFDEAFEDPTPLRDVGVISALGEATTHMARRVAILEAHADRAPDEVAAVLGRFAVADDGALAALERVAAAHPEVRWRVDLAHQRREAIARHPGEGAAGTSSSGWR